MPFDTQLTNHFCRQVLPGRQMHGYITTKLATTKEKYSAKTHNTINEH